MTTVAPDTGVGPLLRDWRRQRRVSQLELALRADSSARHISFIETGRARPSKEMVLRLAEHLDVPVRERNALLLSAGYAPGYTETMLDDPSMGALHEGINQLLRGYEPYPALVVDGRYDVVAANRGIAMLLEGARTAARAPAERDAAHAAPFRARAPHPQSPGVAGASAAPDGTPDGARPFGFAA